MMAFPRYVSFVRWIQGAAVAVAVGAAFPALFATAIAGEPDVIQRIKGSVVAVGTFEKSRNPAFNFHGTGFVVADGSVIATNAHVLPQILDGERRESLAIALPGATPASPSPVRLGLELTVVGVSDRQSAPCRNRAEVRAIQRVERLAPNLQV